MSARFEQDAQADTGPSSIHSHWQRVYRRRAPETVSWYEPVARTSLTLIADAGLPADAAILDAGGGASRLTQGLLDAGYTDLTVADISAAALERSGAHLGERRAMVQWVQADLRNHDFGRTFDLWHDRAVFHFMVDDASRDAYLGTLRQSLRPDGHVVLATFGPNGPEKCSDLPTARYDAEQLSVLLGEDFTLVSSQLVNHLTPSNRLQQFTYAHLQRAG